MTAAWLLTLVAIAGIWLGAHLFRAEKFSGQLAAAGGGLLLGICLFWLVPEIAEGSGRMTAMVWGDGRCERATPGGSGSWTWRALGAPRRAMAHSCSHGSA